MDSTPAPAADFIMGSAKFPLMDDPVITAIATIEEEDERARPQKNMRFENKQQTHGDNVSYFVGGGKPCTKRSSSTAIVCYRCQKSGHRRSDCPSSRVAKTSAIATIEKGDERARLHNNMPLESKQQTHGVNVPYFAGGGKPYTNRSSTTDFVCFRCNKSGHRRSDCPLSQVATTSGRKDPEKQLDLLLSSSGIEFTIPAPPPAPSSQVNSGPLM